MNTTSAEQQFSEFLSKSGRDREIELKFVRRLMGMARFVADPALAHAVAVSGKFNQIFPAVENEGPVGAEPFDRLDAFDYPAWAKRTGVQASPPAILEKPIGDPAQAQLQTRVAPQQARQV